MKMSPVKPFELLTLIKCASHDWLLLDPRGVSEDGSGLKTNFRRIAL